MTRDGGPMEQIEPRGQVISDTPDLLVDVTMRSAGITLLPLFSVIDQVRSGRLERVLPTWRSSDIGVCALFPSKRFIDAKTRAWLDWGGDHHRTDGGRGCGLLRGLRANPVSRSRFADGAVFRQQPPPASRDDSARLQANQRQLVRRRP
ncbi:LysR substrate-binding domain-containing protein [Achromobacter aloeverae]